VNLLCESKPANQITACRARALRCRPDRPACTTRERVYRTGYVPGMNRAARHQRRGKARAGPQTPKPALISRRVWGRRHMSAPWSIQ